MIQKIFLKREINSLLGKKGINPYENLCGFMLETYQGWGAIFYPNKFVKAIHKFAKKYNLLITFDEMQAGFGRTGKLLDMSIMKIEPDILCCGKGASSGPPLSIVLGPSEIMDLPNVGSMSSTHSANPLSCVAGLENMKALIEDGLIQKASQLGEEFHDKLNLLKLKYPKHLKYVFGKGLVAALVFMDENNRPLTKLCDKVSELAFQRVYL